MSAGGQFNYEFVNWKPERVIAFVVNKGGIYYTALSSSEARRVPGLLFIGGMDLEQRVQTITGLFALNRRAGALWALVEEPGAAHVVGRSRDLALMLFEDVLAMRQSDSNEARPVDERSGYLGDRKTRSTWKYGEVPTPMYPVSWLLTRRIADAWKAVLTDGPFGP
jgi:hypothetical protein